ncbi:Berberine bridge enzyme-like 2 [Golovinomyces cichoracearum]|uniref:Berberine bridge enzyme-like 2 n=1 Tax=Golovinomyces cichoracearum TaxID=62708 RepID=A0A420IEH8_9PEZI|nr:Berberine bridge enzyme-like 2 [Golovinomyces cichoracearum]
MISSLIFFISCLIIGTSSRSIASRAENDANTVTSCLNENGVSQINPTSPDWAKLSSSYNLRLQYVPAVITMPKSSTEVSASIRCADKFRLKVQAKGGGHSYASFSSGGQDGSLIISMENFNEISLDPTTFIAKIGTGQRLGNIAQALFDQGKRALPHGTCPSVGIAGHALHGGYGLASRNWGLTIDHIVGMDVVLADGQEIHASGDLNTDIFYAMRGAGDSFGIATFLYFKTEAVPTGPIIHYTVDLGPSLDKTEIASAGFIQLQRATLETGLITNQNTFNFFINSDGVFTLNGWCMECNPDEFRSKTLPSMLVGFNYADIKVESEDWIQAIANLASPDTLAQPLGGVLTNKDNFYAKSLVVPESDPLSEIAIKSFFDYVKQNKGNLNWYSIISLYGGTGSAVSNPPLEATNSAYSDRNSLWNFQNYGFSPSPPFNEALIPLIQGMNDVVVRAQPATKFKGYLNYVDPQLSPAEAVIQYYDNSTYSRLLEIKKRVDPAFIFWNPQAIGLAPPFFP